MTDYTYHIELSGYTDVSDNIVYDIYNILNSLEEAEISRKDKFELSKRLLHRIIPAFTQ